ncbi:MAG: sigma 54-interacting transcriptional regulator, partial [Microcoleaceae cyanobacterium]
MSPSDLNKWLKEATELRLLDQEILDAIALLLQPYYLSADQNLVQEKDIANNLYILQSGKLERLPAKTALLPGVIINLQAIILDHPVRENIISVEDSQLWFLPADMVQELVQKYPQIMQAFSQYLESEVAELSSQLLFEQERQIILRPYLIPKASRAVMGKSRYGVKLRSQIKEAFDNRQPVLIFGEPGLEKDNMAALVHFRSDEYRKEPLVKINCATLQSNGADLFGRQGGSKLGLLEALDQGTLILNNL